MVSCPHCRATLPDGASRCQFCGAAFGPPPPPVPPVPGRRGSPAAPGSPSWVWPAYQAVSVWWILQGAWAVAEFFLAGDMGAADGVGMLIGGATVAIGVGLLLSMDWARGVVNVVCFLNMIFGALGLLSGFAITSMLGWMGALSMILAASQIAMAGFMMYLIGETETKGPNF